MKIERQPLKGKTLASSRSSRSEKKDDFLEALAASQEKIEIEEVQPLDQASQDLRNLAAQIDQYGEALVDNPTPENFLRYKTHIKAFVHQIKSNYELRNISSRKGFGTPKLYLVIENLDQNLDKLAQMVLSREQGRIQYLQLVDSIKGMIIDLTL